MNIIRLSRSIKGIILSKEHNGCIFVHRQGFANAARKDESSSSITKSNLDQSQVSTNVKIAAATKTAGYFGSILIAGGLVTIIGYSLYKELWSSDSPLVLASQAIDKYKKDPNVLNILGEPISVIGQEHYNKARRRHSQYVTFSKDGIKFIQTKCVMYGPNNRGNLFVEFREKDEKSFWSNNWDVTYASLKLNTGRLYVIEDNLNSNFSTVNQI